MTPPDKTTGNALWDGVVARGHADAPAIRRPGGAVIRTHGALRDAALARAAELAELGVRPGDRVTAQVGRSPAASELYLACVAAGAVYVPLNTAAVGAELDHFLRDAEPALMVVDPSTRPGAQDAAARAGVALHDLAAEPPRGRFDPVPRGADDLAAILYTSGTTGRPKGAMLTHGNLGSNARALAECWRWRAGDVLLHALPLFHTHGLFVACNVTLLAGASILLLDRFDPRLVLDALPEATTMMGVPTFYVRLLGEPGLDRAACAGIRLFVSGSAPLLEETHRTFEARTGHVILERYGMTEANMITSNPYDGERRAGTVGRPLPGVDLRIAGPDGEGIGGVELRGPNVMAGYWRNPEKTAETFASDGWFVTGDLGRIDGDGYLSILGRARDLVISGGTNIYPKEVELALDALPGVAESAVFGLPDRDLGEIVAAAIVPEPDARPDLGALSQALADTLARYKHPRRAWLVDALPRNAMGKVQKAELRRIYAGEA